MAAELPPLDPAALPRASDIDWPPLHRYEDMAPAAATPSNGNGIHRDPYDGGGDPDDLSEPTTWERVDLGPWLAGDPPDDSPKLGARSDGQHLLYPGKVHALNGEPECGKSWIAQHVAAQAIQAGRAVTYIDCEDGQASITARMLALGCSVGQIADLFWYHRPDRPLTLEALAVLEDSLVAAGPAVACCDGVTEAMALCALNPYDLGDVAKFWNLIPRRLARTGAAAILVDHVVKDREARGRWAIGSEHKMAAVDGAAFTVEMVKPFGRNREGIARIYVEKDRPGWLRQHANGRTVAQFIVRSWPDGNVDAALEPPESADETFRPTVLMERMSRYVEDHPGLSKHSLFTAVKGDDKAKGLALDLLVAEGYVDRTPGPRGAILHESLRSFRDDTARQPYNQSRDQLRDQVQDEPF